MSFSHQNTKLTLFLWVEGFFPKQVAYYMLIKGLIDSPSQLYRGETNDPRLSVNRIIYTGKSLEGVDPNDPKPAGKSVPCLRIADLTGATAPRWIHESNSIRLYLEELYPENPPMISPTPFDRALMNDIQGTLTQALTDFNFYLKNAVSVTTAWSGMRDEDRSLPVARHAKQGMVRSFVKAQDLASESLESGGWLTPGLDHPGIVDVFLAGGMRYVELSYSFNLLEDEKLELLRCWYARFKEQPWWAELEETGRHPEKLSYASNCWEA